LPGEFAEDAALRLPNLLSNYRPTVLLLFHGYNDLSAGVAVSRIALALDVMAKEGRNRGARVFIATLPPPRAGGTKPAPAASVSNLNDRIRQTAAGEGAVLVDLYAALVTDIPRYIGIDGLHPTEAGYQRIADTFFDAIRNALEVR
jgi:lysophospholipase L1-like esterase